MIHLITGGSGSGKSVYAENWLIRQGGREACGKEKPFLYIAAMAAILAYNGKEPVRVLYKRGPDPVLEEAWILIPAPSYILYDR